MTRGRNWLYAYCLLAGGCDASTGALLILAPGFTLRSMRISELPAQPVYLSFIGAFVGSVGLFYLYPFIYGFSPRTDALLDAVLRLTVLVRVAVGLFVAWSIFRELLAVQWISVALTDLTLAAMQVVMLRRGVLVHAR